MNLLLLAAVALAGAGIPIQYACNRRLETAAHSPALATAISFGIGTALMALLALTGLFGKGSLTGLGDAPWWAWIGGVFSVAVVLASIIALPKAGDEAVVAAAVLGQIVCAAVIDHFGWLGVKQHPLSLARCAGVALVFAGVLLMRK